MKIFHFVSTRSYYLWVIIVLFVAAPVGVTLLLLDGIKGAIIKACIAAWDELTDTYYTAKDVEIILTRENFLKKQKRSNSEID